MDITSLTDTLKTPQSMDVTSYTHRYTENTAINGHNITLTDTLKTPQSMDVTSYTHRYTENTAINGRNIIHSQIH